jgi:hypothetical protein
MSRLPHSPWLNLYNDNIMRTNSEAPYYATFSILLSVSHKIKNYNI